MSPRVVRHPRAGGGWSRKLPAVSPRSCVVRGPVGLLAQFPAPLKACGFAAPSPSDAPLEAHTKSAPPGAHEERTSRRTRRAHLQGRTKCAPPGAHEVCTFRGAGNCARSPTGPQPSTDPRPHGLQGRGELREKPPPARTRQQNPCNTARSRALQGRGELREKPRPARSRRRNPSPAGAAHEISHRGAGKHGSAPATTGVTYVPANPRRASAGAPPHPTTPTRISNTHPRPPNHFRPTC